MATLSHIMWFVFLLENYVDGTEFISLTADEIKAIVPPIGLVKKIMKLRQSVSGNVYKVHHLF